ncbi:hypothetical protein ES705_08073 [subsurface metagenome]
MKKGSFVEFFDGSEIAQNYEDRKEKIEKGGLSMEIFNENTFLKNKPLWLKDLFKKINSFCLDELQKGVVVTHLETYSRFSYNNLMFCKMKSTTETLKVYLKLRYSEIEDPQKWVRDYEKVSRQLWIEITIREEDLLEETILLDNLFDLTKKSFNRVTRHPRLSKIPVVKPVKTLPDFVHPTKMKFDIEIGTNGFCNLGVRVHRSQLTKVLEKLLE